MIHTYSTLEEEDVEAVAVAAFSHSNRQSRKFATKESMNRWKKSLKSKPLSEVPMDSLATE